MDKEDFEGTLVLEKVAAAGLLDEFWEAIDADDFKAAARVMAHARVGGELVEAVLAKMRSADGQH